MSKILESTNYSMFQLTEINRDLHVSKKLKESMKLHGWIDAYPMHVIKNGNGKLKIKAGHNRFATAIDLKIPVKYVICNDDSSIHELERATIKWSTMDYLISYSRAGYDDYIIVLNYIKKTGINLTAAISMLGGESANSYNKHTAFICGKFKVSGLQHALDVADVILHAKECGYQHAHAKKFINAISKILFIEDIDIKHLKNKIKLFQNMMKKHELIADYIKMIDKIYNYREVTKIPITFLAEESARKRIPTRFKKPN